MLMRMATTAAPAAPPAAPEAVPVELARALGDPLRRRITELLAREQLCVAHLAQELETAQPLVSHHLKVLREAGLVEPDRYRYWTYYRQRPGALVRLAATLGLVARSIAALAEEFRGTYSLATVERYVNESIGRLQGAREVLFVCVHNAGRSQVAAALLDEDWALEDPAGQPVEVVRRIRDDLDLRVQALLAELVPARA
jgi:ArsR family transcriptional regulator